MPSGPLLNLALFFAGIIIILIGLNILWSKKIRPSRMNRRGGGIATPTFSNIFRRTVRLLIKEDTKPIEKFKNAGFGKILTWRNFYFVMFFGLVAAIALSQWILAATLGFTLVLIAMGRVRKVFLQRNKILMRMFEVASSRLSYGRDAALNPWGYVDIQEWENLVIPGKTIVSFPAKFRADDPRQREEFQNHFDGVVTNDNIWSYDWENAKGYVECKPVPNLPTMAKYPGSNSTWDKIPLGLGIDGEIVWDLTVCPHMLVCGGTGGGKSVLQRNIINHIIQHSDDIKFLGIDLKRVELKPFGKYDDAVLGVATELEDGVDVMRYGYDEMMRRYTEMENLGVNHFRDLPEKIPALLIMVDEAYMFMAPSGVKTDEGKAEDELHGESVTLIGKIARLGRAAGVHLVLATQRPDAKVIYGEIKENLSARYTAGRMKTTASLMVLDTDTATRIPGNIKGRGVVSFNGEEQFIQGYFAPQSWIDEWLDRRNGKPIGDIPEPTDNEEPELKIPSKKRFSLKKKQGNNDDNSVVENEELSESLSFEKEDVPAAEEEQQTHLEALLEKEGLADIAELIRDEDSDSERDNVDASTNGASNLRWEDDEEEDEGFIVAEPKTTAPVRKEKSALSRPVMSSSTKEKTPEAVWDDDLDSIFTDIPVNTPKKETKEEAVPAQAPGMSRPVLQTSRPSAPTRPVAPTRPARPTPPSGS